MAADAVDAGAEDLPRRVAPSCTDRVPLLGAEGYFAMRNQVDALAAEYGLHPYRIAARPGPIRVDDPRSPGSRR